ncbi:MAG: universal stress protein, partial [Gammaproteobacteria bacterium]|nr:universal stress protein [Gammaproteobacteria bacterium]
HVMAAVDLGTRIRSKKKLNFAIVEHAHRMATALGSELHVAYAVPLSVIMRDLEILDKFKLRDQGRQRAEQFRASLSKRGIEIDGMHVGVGIPEKVLVSIAAKQHARLMVLGCIGRKRLAGRVIGNTAEKILRLLKADILAIKP